MGGIDVAVGGGSVAAPVFARVVAQALRILGVAPDAGPTLARTPPQQAAPGDKLPVRDLAPAGGRLT